MLLLHPRIVVSIRTEFVENQEGNEARKQDCERKACQRLMEKLEKNFPRLPICVCVDSLYAYEGFFQECKDRHWRYILRFKEGSIPNVAEEYCSLKSQEGNRRGRAVEGGKEWYDFVNDIDYRGHHLNLAEYGEEKKVRIKKGKKKDEYKEKRSFFQFLTDLPLSVKNVQNVVERGRMRWKIENEGYNTQKQGRI